jgi:hypothetical protein
VTTVNTQLTTLVTKTTGCATSPRPEVAASYAHDRAGNGINGPIAGASWLRLTRKSMTVPAFHDRWPLCSST